MQLIGNILTIFIGFGAISFIILRNNLHLNLENFILLLVPLTILLPPIRWSSTLPMIRFEEIIFYALFSIAILSLSIKHKIIINNKLIYVLLFIIFSMIISTVHAILYLNYLFSYRDVFEFAKIAKFILILLIVSNIEFEDKSYRNFINIFIISMTISAIVGILQHLNIFNINNTISPLYTTSQFGNIDKRSVGTAANPNDFGFILNCGIIFTLNYVFVYKKSIFLNILLIIVMIIAVILTVSRVAFFGMIMAIIYLIYIYKKQLKIPKLYLILSFIIMGVASLIIIKFATKYFITRMSSGINIKNDLSFLSRLLNWKNNLAIWKDSPIFGWGPAKGFQSLIVDSEYILILRRYGIVGIISHLAFYIVPFLHFNRLKLSNFSNEGKIFIISAKTIILVALINNFTNYTFINIQIMDLWMLIIGIVYAIIYKFDTKLYQFTR